MAIINGIPRSILPNSRIKGFDIVLANLNREIATIKGASMRGLIIGASIIHRDTEKTPPLTPVDRGNLRSSYFTVTSKSIIAGRSNLGEEGSGRFSGENAQKMHADHVAAISEMQQNASSISMGGKRNVLMMGYTASYALFVHENIGMTEEPGWRYGPGPGRKRWYTPRPGAGPKWFESSFKRNRDRVIQAIKDNVHAVT